MRKLNNSRGNPFISEFHSNGLFQLLFQPVELEMWLSGERGPDRKIVAPKTKWNFSFNLFIFNSRLVFGTHCGLKWI